MIVVSKHRKVIWTFYSYCNIKMERHQLQSNALSHASASIKTFTRCLHNKDTSTVPQAASDTTRLVHYRGADRKVARVEKAEVVQCSAL